jgi:hypothetical protein
VLPGVKKPSPAAEPARNPVENRFTTRVQPLGLYHIAKNAAKGARRLTANKELDLSWLCTAYSDQLDAYTKMMHVHH